MSTIFTMVCMCADAITAFMARTVNMKTHAQTVLARTALPASQLTPDSNVFVQMATLGKPAKKNDLIHV